MLTGTWPAPSGHDAYALTFDRGRKARLLVIPALFDEANKLRHFTAETMRALDAGGVDSFLPDLPGTNESLAPLQDQSLDDWRAAMGAAAEHFGATHVLTVRGGAMIETGTLPGWRHAPVAGAAQLRGLRRAQALADREAGRASGGEAAMLAGYSLGAAMLAGLEASLPSSSLVDIVQEQLGGPGLWLRAEPAHDPAQAERLAAILLEALA